MEMYNGINKIGVNFISKPDSNYQVKFTMRFRLFLLAQVCSWHAKKGIIYAWIVSRWIVNRWIMYGEIGEPFAFLIGFLLKIMFASQVFFFWRGGGGRRVHFFIVLFNIWLLLIFLTNFDLKIMLSYEINSAKSCQRVRKMFPLALKWGNKLSSKNN